MSPLTIDSTIKLSSGNLMPRLALGVYQSRGAECQNAVSEALKVGYRYSGSERVVRIIPLYNARLRFLLMDVPVVDTAQGYHNEDRELSCSTSLYLLPSTFYPLSSILYSLPSNLLFSRCAPPSRQGLADNPSCGPRNGRIRCIPLQDLRNHQIHALAHRPLVFLRVGGPTQVAQASEQGLRGGHAAVYRRHADPCAVGGREGPGGELEGARSGAEGGVDKGYWGVELVRCVVWFSTSFRNPWQSARYLSIARSCRHEML
jgi:hypothetical protein